MPLFLYVLIVLPVEADVGGGKGAGAAIVLTAFASLVIGVLLCAPGLALGAFALRRDPSLRSPMRFALLSLGVLGVLAPVLVWLAGMVSSWRAV